MNRGLQRFPLFFFLAFLAASGWLAVRSQFLTRAAAQTANSATRADFYVAPDGNDSWSGTHESANAARTDGPFATLERARKAVRERKQGRSAPVVVMLREGTYFLQAPLRFSKEDSGSSNSPVIYQAYPGERPVISGGRRITNWSNPSGNVWTAKLNSRDYRNFEALFFNDERRYRPRTTEDGYLYIERPVISPERTEMCSQPPRQRGMGPGQGQGRRPPVGGGFGGPFGGRRFPVAGRECARR